jgi:hypothetical protein
MSRALGRTAIYQVRRKGTPATESVSDFMRLVKARLQHERSRRRGASSS